MNAASLTQNALASRPDHVPESLVYAFDYFTDPSRAVDVQAGMAQLHRAAPRVFWTPANGGHWIVSHMADLQTVSTRPDLFSSEVAPPFPFERGRTPAPPQDMDGREHLQHRMLLLQFFAPKAVRELEPKLRELMRGLLDEIGDERSCEFKTAVAIPFPVKLFLTLMGMELDRYAEFVSWVNDYIIGTDPQASVAAFRKMTAYIANMVDERLANPGDDVVSVLLRSEVDGVVLAPQTVRDMCKLLFVAGLDTVTNAMCFIMQHLARDHALQDRLREDPALIAPAIEEFLRRYSFVNLPRKARVDNDVLGVQMKAGDVVLISISAANNDDDAFVAPEKFDLNRPANRHIAFNTGPHNCVGAALARQELTVLLEEWLSRFPNVSLGAVPPQRGGPIMSLTELQLVW